VCSKRFADPLVTADRHLWHAKIELVMRTASFLLFMLLAVKSAIAADKISPASKELFAATVRGVAISIHAAARPFDPSRHKTTDLVVKGETAICATIDGRNVVGTDQTLPKAGWPQLCRMYVQFGKKRVTVPERLLTHVFMPNLDRAKFDHQYASSVISVSADGRAVIISLGVGDGGGSNTYSLYVGVDGTCTTEEPARPEP